MNVHDDPAPSWNLGERECAIVRSGHVLEASFELAESDGIARGMLTVTLARGDERVRVGAIRLDLDEIARNDPSAFTYPRAAAAILSDERAVEIALALLPRLHLLTRARVVPLEAMLTVENVSRAVRRPGAARRPSSAGRPLR